MSPTGVRQPPRFVPTLTDVVSELGPQAGLDAPSVSLTVESSADPESVGHAQETPSSLNQSVSKLVADDSLDAPLLAQGLQERLMERVSGSLEERLRYALGEVVQLHSQSLYQALRSEVERLVSEAVHEAVAHELAQMRQTKKN